MAKHVRAFNFGSLVVILVVALVFAFDDFAVGCDHDFLALAGGLASVTAFPEGCLKGDFAFIAFLRDFFGLRAAAEFLDRLGGRRRDLVERNVLFPIVGCEG